MPRSLQDIKKELDYMDKILLYVIRTGERPTLGVNVPDEIIEYWKSVDDFVMRSNRVYRSLESEYNRNLVEYDSRNSIIESHLNS